MAQQIINDGTIANDGTGDSLRTAATKINSNFTELYTDVTNNTAGIALAAPLASPAFTGNPTAPTQLSSDNSTRLATTAYVNAVLSSYVLTTALSSYAPLASPAFTGTPTAPTPAAGTNSNAIATTSYVVTALGSYAPLAGASFTGSVSVSAGNDAFSLNTNFSSALLGVDGTQGFTWSNSTNLVNTSFATGDNRILTLALNPSNGHPYLRTGPVPVDVMGVNATTYGMQTGGAITTLQWSAVISTNTAASPGYYYVATAALTLTLPATPPVNTVVGWRNLTGSTTALVIAPGGTDKISGQTGSMTVDVVGASGVLMYTGVTYGWC